MVVNGGKRMRQSLHNRLMKPRPCDTCEFERSSWKSGWNIRVSHEDCAKANNRIMAQLTRRTTIIKASNLAAAAAARSHTRYRIAFALNCGSAFCTPSSDSTTRGALVLKKASSVCRRAMLSRRHDAIYHVWLSSFDEFRTLARALPLSTD